MPTVTIRYWAGARAAAGVEAQDVIADTVAEALDAIRRERQDPRFDRVLNASSLLIDGVAAHDGDLGAQLQRDIHVEVLPPFAGG